MKKRLFLLSSLITILVIFLLSVSFSCREYKKPHSYNLTGMWKGKVQFRTGDYAQIKDLEFMRVYNAGGTMTESSNYDGVPPTPPAYGIWKKTGTNKYETRYEFYWNNVPPAYEDLKMNGGFSPGGYGILTEKITLSEDGKSYTSKISFSSFDKTGKQLVSGDEGDTEAKKMEFDEN